MKPKTMFKMAIDLIMTILLPILMAYHLTGELAHEWIGAVMLSLFVLHHVLNITWYKNLFRGRYSARRTVETVVNLLISIATIGLIVSGVILSRHVFTALPISGRLAFGRTLHHISSYWVFVLLSVHLGLHGKSILGMLRRALRVKTISRGVKILLRLSAASVSAYGVYAFVKHQIVLYLFNVIQFSFFDYGQPAIIFFADYLAIMGMLAVAAHYTNCLLSSRAK